ncbi:MAG: glycoside hydrolase family 13 protein [Acidimicrobiia bacterium]
MRPSSGSPSWVRDAVFYQIFPDRFARSGRTPQPAGLEPWDSPPSLHGYKGGDLAGITDRLDWLTDLGVDAVYLNPIFASASSHRYHTHDYFKIDPLLGNDAAFDAMLEGCHSRGLRVVLDGVFNHASRGFLPFNDLMENGASSPWRDWFIVHEWPVNGYTTDPPSYEAWWGMAALPKLNTENPEVRTYLMGVAEHWLRRGIDGWRLDVPEEITTEGFWEEFRTRVRTVNPDAYLVGEVWGDATAWIGDGSRFDATMNYPFTEAAIAFAVGSRVDLAVVEPVPYSVSPPLDGDGYSQRITRLLASYPDDTNLANLNLLGSHDTPRIRSVAGGDARSVELAMVLMLTFPGAPCIYYGDEVGLLGEHDPGCRGTFPWDDPDRWDRGILQTVKELIALRRSHSGLRSPVYEALWPPHPGPKMHVARRGDSPAVIVAVNAGDSSETARCRLGDVQQVWGTGRVVGSDLTVPARSAAIWVETAPQVEQAGGAEARPRATRT